MAPPPPTPRPSLDPALADGAAAAAAGRWPSRAERSCSSNGAACAAALDAPFEEQLHGALRAIVGARAAAGHKGAPEVAFTITDMSYGDMLHEVATMVARVGLRREFFYIALDRATALGACASGYRVVLLDAAEAAAEARQAHAGGDAEGMAKKRVVYSAKCARPCR